MCTLCRQLRNTASLLREVATPHADGDDDEEDAEPLLEQLALLNDLDEIASDASTCNAWGQEILGRAYALQVASRWHLWPTI